MFLKAQLNDLIPQAAYDSMDVVDKDKRTCLNAILPDTKVTSSPYD
jgi:hypothetical protein